MIVVPVLVFLISVSIFFYGGKINWISFSSFYFGFWILDFGLISPLLTAQKLPAQKLPCLPSPAYFTILVFFHETSRCSEQ
jgi:hypothetical protein